jgi:hypothetical protein
MSNAGPMSNCLRFAVLTLFILGAAQLHAQAAHSGYSAAGLYNLGNTYARQGKPGMAVLNYERARLLSPKDPDIDDNLNYVRISSHLPVSPRSAFDRTVRIAGPVALSWIGVIGLMIFGVSVVAVRWVPRHRWLRRFGMLLGISLLSLTACNGIAVWPILHEGIVITATTAVRVSPVPMGESLFVLPEAEAVTISAEHEGFLLIRTREGRTGWVSRSNVASVIPQN